MSATRGPGDARFVSSGEMMRWVERVVSFGVRRPGYPGDTSAEQFVIDQFRALGLEAVRFEPVESVYWEDHAGVLEVEAPGASAVTCFPVPLSEPTVVRAPLVRWDPARRDEMAGKVVLYDLAFASAPDEFPVWARRQRAVVTDPDPADPAASGWAYDPEGTFAEGRHRLPFPPEIQNTMEPAIAAGAAGFVGVLRGYPGGCQYYVPYDGVFRSIPGVYVDGADGDRLAALAEGGECVVRLEVAATRGTTPTRNVVGELAGADDEWVVIGTHHDAPWASAVEDATGIAMLLGQAAAWASVPAAERPHHVVFVATAAHMAHAAGTRAFIERHRDAIDRTVLEVHLEHAALEEPAGRVTPRWWFTTESPRLERAVWDAVRTHGLDRSLLLTPDALAPFPTTDGGFFHVAGVPLVNYLAAPWYLFDPADTMDKVDERTLAAVTRAVVDIVASTRGVSAAQMRASVAPR